MAASTAQAPVRLALLVPGEPPMPPVKPDAKKDDKAKADEQGQAGCEGDEKKPDAKSGDKSKCDDKKEEENQAQGGFAPLPEGHEMRFG